MLQTKNALRDPEAAEYIGMSESFLRQSRMDGIRENRTPGPPFVKIGRSVRYLVEDLEQWLKQYRQEPAKGTEL
ncbi:MAG: helix-turn-helix domain-containing protein [Candidatus Tectomicrobia bacterium]|uniref:Helix-turn-helix domain-containing protein n=1 Tax=Tectimicrobiota bacterium TaxID=2528274 RepID=A0A938B2U6_UNCTE|nr:helix-turn-helix domain-containing protein [Candidatus Tectomicrobia bacterium]